MGITMFVTVQCYLLSLPAKIVAFLSYIEKVGWSGSDVLHFYSVPSVMQLSIRKCIFLGLLGLRKMVWILTYVLEKFSVLWQNGRNILMLNYYGCLYLMYLQLSWERFLTQENYDFSYYLKVEKYVSFCWCLAENFSKIWYMYILFCF